MPVVLEGPGVLESMGRVQDASLEEKSARLGQQMTNQRKLQQCSRLLLAQHEKHFA
jgi:hypothetical protein